MPNSNGTSIFPSPLHTGKQSSLSLKNPISTESLFIEDQPSWLDDLLNEPEIPLRKGAHRRSSSDSFAYLNASNISLNFDSFIHGGYKHHITSPSASWGQEELDHLTNVQCPSYHTKANSIGKHQNNGWGSTMNNVINSNNNLTLTRDKTEHLGSSSATREPDILASSVIEKLSKEESSQKGFTKQREGSQIKLTQSEMEAKQAKQQFAQRSRVRKLQYIAELERHIQVLQIEGMGVSAELEFLDQQNFILSLENKALKQRLDGLLQEHLVKCLQREMLEREIARLRALYHHHQQQPPPPTPPTHSRSNSRDLEIQFANLSLKHKESNSGREPITGPLYI